MRIQIRMTVAVSLRVRLTPALLDAQHPHTALAPCRADRKGKDGREGRSVSRQRLSTKPRRA